MRDRSTPLTETDIGELAWQKMGGLIPALVQDRLTGEVLTLASLHPDAVQAALASGRSRAQSNDPSSYTRKLLDGGPALIGKKVGEEGVEVALAGVSRDAAGCTEEVADLIYHVSVLMEARGFGWDDVVAVLKSRH